jgi:CSLREA domain-containing protein
MRTALLRFGIFPALLWLVPAIALATNRTVTNLNDSGTGSLRDTIAASSDGDSIDFSIGGDIALTNGELLIAHSITILGPGAAYLTVFRHVSAPTTFRVFRISNGTPNGPNVSISGMTISHGVAPSDGAYKGGGGILNEFSALTLTNCLVEDNTDSVTGNFRFGGGIFNDGYDPATNGHGSGAASLTLVNCTVRNNAELSEGGGIASYGNFNGNTSLMITNSTIYGNGPSGSSLIIGGGIRSILSKCTIVNSTIANNRGDGGGGISFGDNGSLRSIVNCTISGNGDTNATLGGGIYNGAFTILNTIVADNVGSPSPDVYDAGHAVASRGHNFIGKTDGSSGWVASDYTGTSVSPLDPQLGSLQDNGGPTQTMAVQPTSAAIDAADDSVLNAPLSLTTDQRGPGFPRKLGAHVDIGAFEFDSALPGPAFIVTTAADHDDGNCGALDCTLREAINAANADGMDSTITFAPGVPGIITLTSALPDVTSNIALQGPGARVLALNGSGAYRAFSFLSGTSTISGLTINNGLISTVFDGASVFGGGIFNQATLTLTDCALTGNQARGNSASFSGSGGSGEGGAIYNNGVLSLNRCTVSGNSAGGGNGANATTHNAGGGGSATGGIYNDSAGTLTLNNCTVANNTALGGIGGTGGSHAGGNGGYAYGGVFNLGAMTMSACTVTGNDASGGAAGNGNPNGSHGIPYAGVTNRGTSIVGDTISAQNGSDVTVADTDGAFNSGGYNLIGNAGTSTGFVNGVNHDQVGVNANLGSFGNNGGPTDTVALLSNSPAKNAGDPNASSQDQRYYLRSGTPDIGAFEFSGMLAPISMASRKPHGASTFDIVLPISGASGDECRSGGATGDYQIVLTFATPVSVTGNPEAQITSGIGQIGSGGTPNGGMVTVNGSSVTVPLTNVANAQRITLSLYNVSDGSNTNNVAVPIGFLLGDTNGNGAVNASDVSQTKAKSGQTIDPTNFRNDVTVSGSINASDVSLVKSKSGTALP